MSGYPACRPVNFGRINQYFTKEEAMPETITVFRPYPFQVGEKLRIEGGRRGGDWEVAAVDDKAVTLRCPISGREFAWSPFCYFIKEDSAGIWPQPS